MLTCIKLQPNMPCEQICYHAQQALTKYQKENIDMTDTILIIDIKKITDGDSLIPKIEHKIIDS